MRYPFVLTASLLLALAPALPAQTEEEREIIALTIRVVAAIDDGHVEALEDLGEGLDAKAVVEEFATSLLFDVSPERFPRRGDREAEVVRRFEIWADHKGVTVRLIAGGGVHNLHLEVVKKDDGWKVARVYQTGW